jgi:hypothetical protein
MVSASSTTTHLGRNTNISWGKSLSGRIGTNFLTVGTNGADLHRYKQQREYSANHCEDIGFLKIKLMDRGNAIQVTYQDINGETEDKFTVPKSTQGSVR